MRAVVRVDCHREFQVREGGAVTSTIEWHRYGDVVPQGAVGVYVLIVVGGVATQEARYWPGSSEWTTRDGFDVRCQAHDLWAYFPEPPKEESDG